MSHLTIVKFSSPCTMVLVFHHSHEACINVWSTKRRRIQQETVKHNTAIDVHKGVIMLDEQISETEGREERLEMGLRKMMWQRGSMQKSVERREESLVNRKVYEEYTASTIPPHRNKRLSTCCASQGMPRKKRSTRLYQIHLNPSKTMCPDSLLPFYLCLPRRNTTCSKTILEYILVLYDMQRSRINQ